jgi:Holliday junction DNA helicase RuvB
VVFVDEVHTLARRADAFLNLFEPKERRAVCRNRVGDFRNAAFLTATTEKGRLPGPFRSRFRIIDLEPYTLEEVSRIAQQAFAASGVPCPVEVGALLAKVGRLVPRTVIETAGNFIELHQFSPHAYPISVPGIEEAMSRVWNVDPNGLTNNDREYLTALESGPKGLSALTAMLSANREEIERIIEPYLIQLAAIRHTPRGREITEMGRSMLSADAP